jgi:stage II sporulation protein D
MRIALGSGIALLALLGSAVPAQAEDLYSRPANGTFRISGHGWGHGHGMSQWGAQGAATLGKRYTEILARYYPGTTLSTVPTSTRIRVQLSRDTDGDLRVRAAAGLQVANGKRSQVLPGAIGGKAVSTWRVRRSGVRLVLEYAASGWKPATFRGAPASFTGAVVFRAAAGHVRMVYPAGDQRDYRGELRAVVAGGRFYSLDVLRLEDYLRSVLPVEMSPNWQPEALKAQAVAARTYSLWKLAQAQKAGKPYDICDSTSCQVYAGLRAYGSTGKLTRAYEAKGTDAAVTATAGRALTYRGEYVFAEFSASNGGYSTAGDKPYLRIARDPWDGAVPNPVHAWRTTVTAGQVEKAYPAVGSLRRIRVLTRDGYGEWGGRILTLRVEGTARSATVTGAAFQNAIGIRSRWWTVTG